MNRKICLLLLSFIFLKINVLHAQEFNLDISVSAAQVAGTDQRVFEALKEGVINFMNNRVWTNISIKPEERIEGALLINVKKKTDRDKKSDKFVVILINKLFANKKW